MKYIFLAFFVLLSAQPMQVSSCDMHQSQGSSHGGHTEMPGHNMDGGEGMDMDCCDHNPSTPTDQCDSMSHCGACTASVVTTGAPMMSLFVILASRQFTADTSAHLSSYSSPPFRPPIV